MKNAITLSVISLFAFGCGGSGDPVSADVSYRLECPATASGMQCPSGIEDDYAINQFDGAGGVEATCSAASVGNTIDLTLEAIAGGTNSQSGITINNLRVDPQTNAVVGASCKILVLESGAHFGDSDNGVCGADPPSPTQPCQVTNVSINGDSVQLSVACDELASGSQAPEIRDVRGVGSAATATLSFENCDGL